MRRENYSIPISKKPITIWSLCFLCCGLIIYLIPAVFLFNMTFREYILTLRGNSVVLVVVLFSLGLFLGWWSLVLFGTFMFSGAASDFIMLWLTRKMPRDIYVIDHPQNLGFAAVMTAEEAKERSNGIEQEISSELMDLKGFLKKMFKYVIVLSLIFLTLYYLGFYAGRWAAKIF